MSLSKEQIQYQIDQQIENEANNAPRLPDGSRIEGAGGGMYYTREDRKRQIINGEEDAAWNSYRMNHPWLFR